MNRNHGIICLLFLSICLISLVVSQGYSEKKTISILSDSRGDPSPVIKNSVVVVPFQFPPEIHDGVKWHLKKWVEEIPYLILDSDYLCVVSPDQVQARPGLVDPRQYAISLKAGSVLTGSVNSENDGELLTIRAELIQSSTGFLMWAKTWTIEDVFQKNDRLDRIRSEIAQRVRKRLEGEIITPSFSRN